MNAPARTEHLCACPQQCNKAAVDLSFVDQAVKQLGRKPEALIPLLQALQNHYRYLPEPALKRLSELTDIHASDLMGVATFYNQFRLKPAGERIIRVCHGTACHVKGAEHISEAFRRQLNLKAGEDTDAQGRYTVEQVGCLGCCTLAPVVAIGDVTYGHVTVDSVADILQADQRYQQRARRPGAVLTPGTDKQIGEIRVGLGSCCMAKGSHNVLEAFEQAIAQIDVPVRVKRVGCVCVCHQTPIVEIDVANGPPALYVKVQPEDAAAIVARHFKPPGLFKRAQRYCSSTLELFLTDEGWDGLAQRQVGEDNQLLAPFLGPQLRIATEHSGILDPVDLDEYIARDGFQALRRCLTQIPADDVIDTVLNSGLRGRGGAGFPSGVKWRKVREQAGQPKYVICNGDEGDPGAFMDRMLLESFPYRVLEGMAIAARAVGAHEGILYIRAEYPLAVKRIREALQVCHSRGWLGKNIQGSGFDLTLRVFEGAGAFVCGEETALLESVEGRRGIPRVRPPFPAEKGLFGQPTLINNVETLAMIPWIIRHGAAAFAKLGTAKSAGTKVFALAGKVLRGGLIEVPMGMTIRQIVEDIGGGVASGRNFKAVQIGGPSGGCVPAALCDTAVDYEALAKVGAIMGSGGLVVLDDTDCMVDMARYFLQFTQNESCGRCTFCRLGTRRMLDILEGLCAGKGSQKDLGELEYLARMTQQTSLCGLGRTAPNPVLSTLTYFRDEYQAHVQKGCPGGRCKGLIHYVVTEKCIGCTRCAQRCPVSAIAPKPYQRHVIDDALCTRCDSCRQGCPENAIKVE